LGVIHRTAPPFSAVAAVAAAFASARVTSR
jgi:hypothetical protein